MYAIETDYLTKSFKGFKAVDGLNLKVPEGSVYGFLGPNGAGKTTTIKMLTGLSKPSNGDIMICGKPVEFGSLKNRTDIGYLPDVPNFYDWMRPDEFLKFVGGLFSIDGKTLGEKVDSLMELVGLKGVRKKVGGFSRGMKQRLGIAQALINDPKVVFLDEPTSALDPIGRKEVMDIIGKLAGHVTVFFSTHILSDIERVCDRVVILNKGRIMIEDSMVNLRNKHTLQGVVMEVEASEDVKKELLAEIKGRGWFKSMTESQNGEIKVVVSESGIAEREIPGIIYNKGIALRKFSVLEPSLEDIFLKVVDKQ